VSRVLAPDRSAGRCVSQLKDDTILHNCATRSPDSTELRKTVYLGVKDVVSKRVYLPLREVALLNRGDAPMEGAPKRSKG